ncbi:hypothetical protein LRLP16767_LR202_01342 [Limosilactobacillus reuteri]|uniref:Uncharacterized protein n=1 Tax=Limosilactobacillus reuteri TaxID=1598 RepID=A0A0U5JV14_LIMRT|nr:hypothetical protein [Limosilactobacillus reuteri]CUR41280.1 hypothetical protein LRLP16767_LR202_01342 [Limosilactobacillus reuteri]
MILLFLRWLIRLPLLLVIGTLLAGMLIGTYKIFTHFWGEDIFSEILKRREKEKQLNKKIQENKDWERRLSYEEAHVRRKEDEIDDFRKKVKQRIKKLDIEIDEKARLVRAWRQMNEVNTLSLNSQVGAIKIARERIISRANKDTFYKSLKNVSKEFTIVTPDDVEVVRHYLQEQFIDNNDCEAFVMNVYDLLVGRHVNCYVAAWMLYTMLHSDLPD